MNLSNLELRDLIRFARAYATGYYDGRTQGVEYNSYRDDAQRHGYRLGYDSGVADFGIEDEGKEKA